MNKDFVSINKDRLICLFPYFPTRLRPQDEISNEILAFKDGNRDTIKTIFKIIESLSKQAKRNLFQNSIIVVVPPSKIKKNFKTPCHKLAKMILFEYGKAYSITDGTKYLYRYIDKKSAHQGGSRSVQIHLDTIKSLVFGKPEIQRKIIIIDDIFTTGNSMEACRQILSKKFLYSDFFFLTIGRTIIEDRKHYIFICDENNILTIYNSMQKISMTQLCSIVFVGNFNNAMHDYFTYIKHKCYTYSFNSDIANGIEQILLYAGVAPQEAYIVSNSPEHLLKSKAENFNTKAILLKNNTWEPFNSCFQKVDIAITNTILNMEENYCD